MYLAILHRLILLTIFFAALAAGNVLAQGLTDREWVLNPKLSNVYMQTVKANAVFETHQFTAVEGSISKDAVAKIRIELASLDTGHDLRDVRMRFLLFETFKFPHAEIRADLDSASLRALSTRVRMKYPLKFSISMHGIETNMEALVWVTRIDENTVSVTTVNPIIVTAETFNLTKNVAKLVEIIGGKLIAPAASITIDLVFGSGELKQDLVAARENRAKRRALDAASAITTEACETRMQVISKTRAIYFGTGSAQLNQDSAPLLDSVADIAKRCPSVAISVAGHTDDVGSNNDNQILSERRAKSVVDYLTDKGVDAKRIQSAGYGETRPIVPNVSDTNRAKNRRIEFKVIAN